MKDGRTHAQGTVRQCPLLQEQAQGHQESHQRRGHSKPPTAVPRPPPPPSPRRTGESSPSESPGACFNQTCRKSLTYRAPLSLPDERTGSQHTACQVPRAPTGVVLRVRVVCRGLRRGRKLRQLQVVLPLLPHPVRVGAACVPLDPDPAILSKFTDHAAEARRRSVLRKPKQRPVKSVRACLSQEHCL